MVRAHINESAGIAIVDPATGYRWPCRSTTIPHTGQ